MPAAEVFFATNRQYNPHASGGFGYAPVAPDRPDQATYGVAHVSGTDLDDPNSGQITAFDTTSLGSFDAAATARLVGGTGDLLVFIHGYANAFTDAITRAAFVKRWLEAANDGRAITVLAFSWPSQGEVGDYFADRQRAEGSGLHLAAFLRGVGLLAERRPGARVCLLAHSMGNHALRAAMEAQTPPELTLDRRIFHEAVLAAADEAAYAFEIAGAGLGKLRQVAGRVSVYSSQADTAMKASFLAHVFDDPGNKLGYAGPTNKTDPARYPVNAFRSVDCTAVRDFDFNPLIEPLASHQYYRRSPTVRADIAAVLAGGTVRDGVSELWTVD